MSNPKPTKLKQVLSEAGSPEGTVAIGVLLLFGGLAFLWWFLLWSYDHFARPQAFDGPGPRAARTEGSSPISTDFESAGPLVVVPSKYAEVPWLVAMAPKIITLPPDELVLEVIEISSAWPGGVEGPRLVRITDNPRLPCAAWVFRDLSGELCGADRVLAQRKAVMALQLDGGSANVVSK